MSQVRLIGMGSFCGRGSRHLRGGQIVDAGLAVQSSYPRLLLATVWHDGLVAVGGVVDMDHAGVDLPGDPYAAGDVAGVEGAGQSEVGVVGDVDRLLVVAEFHQQDDGPEHFVVGQWRTLDRRSPRPPAP